MVRKTGVYGDREVTQALRQLARGVQTSAVDAAGQESLQPMLADAKGRAKLLRQPGKTPKGGHLDQGLVIRRTGASRTRRSFWVGAMRRARSIAHLVEFGTAPHWQPKRGIMHPGARPKPFLTPAYLEHGDDVVTNFGRGLWKAISIRVMQLRKR